MKTTLEIPDELFRRAKTLAASQGITLKQLFTEALEDRLARNTYMAREPRAAQVYGSGLGAGAGGGGAPLWMAGFGGLADLGDDHQQVMGWIEESFEVVEPEDVLP